METATAMTITTECTDVHEEPPAVPKLVRFREYTRGEWENIARKRQVEPCPTQPHSEDWYTFQAYQSCASREEHLEAAKEKARYEREHPDECGAAEDSAPDCA